MVDVIYKQFTVCKTLYNIRLFENNYSGQKESVFSVSVGWKEHSIITIKMSFATIFCIVSLLLLLASIFLGGGERTENSHHNHQSFSLFRLCLASYVRGTQTQDTHSRKVNKQKVSFNEQLTCEVQNQKFRTQATKGRPTKLNNKKATRRIKENERLTQQRRTNQKAMGNKLGTQGTHEDLVTDTGRQAENRQTDKGYRNNTGFNVLTQWTNETQVYTGKRAGERQRQEV